MAFIRSSKFRHVFGAEPKKENYYEDFRPTNCAFEGTFIAANSQFLAFCVETGGSGSFCVIPIEKTGRLSADIPKVNGHKEYVLDLAWSPFQENLLATCSEDGTIRIWQFEKNGPLTNWDKEKALLALEYHERRCSQIVWHPIASNVLMSVSQEPKLCIWNLDAGTAEVEIDLKQIVYHAAWSNKGDKIVTSCKDKNFRIYDARSLELIAQGQGHDGSKPQRCIFTYDDTFLFSCGFSKQSDRQYAAWRVEKDTIKHLNGDELDTVNGSLIPYYDPGTQMVYLAAKGDSVIRYYELSQESPYFHYISTFQSSKAQRSLCCIQKREVDVNSNEVMKFYKLCNVSNKGVVIPVSFTVPRKSDLFQDDLYPDAISAEPAIDACEWFEGKNVSPNLVQMVTFFKGKSKPKPSGGLKKGGLKGLKAKKDAKEAAKNETSTPTPASVPSKTPSPEPVKTEPVRSTERVTTKSPSPSADPKVVEELKGQVKTLQDDQKKMRKEITSLTDKLKDYEKLTNDIKLLCNAVKKNDERVAALEALVQEESETEDA